MVATDAAKLKTGGHGVKLNLVCAKRTFSLLVSPHFEKFTENLIDEEIVLKMNLPIVDRKCETVSIRGLKTEAVGFIKTTAQCLQDGVQHGTVYLKARVVRGFYKLFSSDGLCSEKLQKKLFPDSQTSEDESESDTEHDDEKAMRKGSKKKCKTEPTQKQSSASKPKVKNANQVSPSSLDTHSSTPKRKRHTKVLQSEQSSRKNDNADIYTNQSIVLNGSILNPTSTDSQKRFAFFHLGRPIPRKLMNTSMPHGRVWCNPRCTDQGDMPAECGYSNYHGQMCGSMCPGKFCQHNTNSNPGHPVADCAPGDHQLHVYQDVVDEAEPQSPPPKCQGNYIQYSVLQPMHAQRSPGGGPLKKWRPWYHDRRSGDYTFQMPEDFDPDGSFHSIRSMESLLSSSPGSYATDGFSIYQMEDTSSPSFNQQGFCPPSYNQVDQAIVHEMFVRGHIIPEHLQHVPIPHGEEWCTPDCPWLGSRDLPYDCGYHNDWGLVIPCGATCSGGWCQHNLDTTWDGQPSAGTEVDDGGEHG